MGPEFSFHTRFCLQRASICNCHHLYTEIILCCDITTVMVMSTALYNCNLIDCLAAACSLIAASRMS